MDTPTCIADGEILVDGFALSRLDGAAVVAEGKRAAREVALRAGINIGDTQG